MRRSPRASSGALVLDQSEPQDATVNSPLRTLMLRNKGRDDEPVTGHSYDSPGPTELVIASIDGWLPPLEDTAADVARSAMLPVRSPKRLDALCDNTAQHTAAGAAGQRRSRVPKASPSRRNAVAACLRKTRSVRVQQARTVVASCESANRARRLHLSRVGTNPATSWPG
jgi:hypothetical protein